MSGRGQIVTQTQISLQRLRRPLPLGSLGSQETGSPKGTHTLITGTLEWVMLHDKNDFSSVQFSSVAQSCLTLCDLAGIIKVMGLKHGEYLN